MKLDKELVAASTVPLVLGILEKGESYGYAIIQRVREISRDEIQWTDGMLYPVLHWLEDQDYIASTWREADTGRKRKYYTIRSKGRKYLEQQQRQWMLVDEALRRVWTPTHA